MKPEQMKPTPARFSKEIPCEKGYELRRGCEGVSRCSKTGSAAANSFFWNTYKGATRARPRRRATDARRERKAGRRRVIGSRSKRRTAARSRRASEVERAIEHSATGNTSAASGGSKSGELPRKRARRGMAVLVSERIHRPQLGGRRSR